MKKLISVLCVCFLLTSMSGCGFMLASLVDDSSTGETIEIEQEVETETDPETESTENNTEREADVEIETKVEIENQDMAIILAEGHPTYYGSTEEAHRIWGDAEKGKVIFADSNEKYTDKTIIYMNGYEKIENDLLISDIEVYFSNFSEPVNVGLDEALNIAKTYLPEEIIDTYYEFKHSFRIQPVNESKVDIYTSLYFKSSND